MTTRKWIYVLRGHGESHAAFAHRMRNEVSDQLLDLGPSKLSLTLTDLELGSDGTFSVTEATTNDLGTLSKKVGLAGVLPVVIETLEVKFSEAGNFDTFDLRANGYFDMDALEDLPFEPVIRIGEVQATRDNTFDFAVSIESLQEGRIGLIDYGEIELGVTNWEIDPFVVGGTITLEISDDGGTSFTPLKVYAMGTQDSSQQADSFDISAYIASNTQIRFSTSNVLAPAYAGKL